MEELKACPLCNKEMKEFSDGNFGHSMEYSEGIESTCPLRGQLFNVSERRAWNTRVDQSTDKLIDEIKRFRSRIEDKVATGGYFNQETMFTQVFTELDSLLNSKRKKENKE